MASIRSLGFHEAPAIPFLVSESLLPPDPSKDDYIWQTGITDSTRDGSVDEEVLYTRTCVVWCQGGVVKRVFRFDQEKEEIRHVLFTNFPMGKPGKTDAGVSSRSSSILSSESSNGGLDCRLPTKSKRVEPQDATSRPVSNINAIDANQSVGDLEDSPEKLSRTLVVVLKSQVHIFFLTGNSHVISLPFEVDSVFAAPQGLIFQREFHEESRDSNLAVPPTSFASSLPQTEFRASQSIRLSAGKGTRPFLTASPAQPLRWTLKPNSTVDLPRVFSLTDPHSEMGLVVANYSSRSVYEGGAFDTLSPADEIIYVSHSNELRGVDRALSDRPLIFIVTFNTNLGLYTLWTARYREEESCHIQRCRKRPMASGTRSKRRSSHYGITTGATTPAARPSGLWESFGAGRNISGASFGPGQQTEEKPDDAELAFQIGHEFGDIGVPLKASRRVSSLLARADLATSQDRATFSDLATGSQSNSIVHGAVRQSAGGYSNRASLAFNARSSIPTGNGSVYSTNSSFLDAPVDKLLEELNNGGDYEGFDNMHARGSISGLPTEIMLMKVETFSPGGSQISFSDPETSQSPKVFTLHPDGNQSVRKRDSTTRAVYILDRNLKSLIVVNVRVEKVKLSSKGSTYPSKKQKGHLTNRHSLIVQATRIQHSSNIVDACKVVDGEVSRILVLSTTVDNRNELTLQSPWSTLTKIELPAHFMLHEPISSSLPKSPHIHRDSGLRGVVSHPPLILIGLGHSSTRGKVDVIDLQRRRHRIQLQMEPSNTIVKNIIGICRFALRDLEKAADGILIGWWEVSRWLRSRNESENDLELTAIVVVLFTMAVGFIESHPTPTPVKQTRKKTGLLRSSSGTQVDLESWCSMLDQEAGSSGAASSWMMSSPWCWVMEHDLDDADELASRLKTDQHTTPSTARRKNPYLVQCASLARDFLGSPQGEAASGLGGYLPTAVSRDPNTRRIVLCTVLIGLHLLREEQKLSIYDSESSYKETGMLVPILAQIGRWLGWRSWTWKDNAYYGTETANMDRWLFEDTQISRLEIPPEPFPPPSIFSFLKDSLYQPPSTSFFTLLDLVSAADSTLRNETLWQEAFALTPKTLALRGFVSELNLQSTSVEKVKLMLRWGLTQSVIENFPEGVGTPLHEAIVQCQINPPTSWNAALAGLIDRDDLFMSINGDNSQASISRSQLAFNHDATRDFHHIGASALDVDASNSFEASAEADRFLITRLIFREDRRFIEAARLLNQSKAPTAECVPEPEWSETDLLEAQKALVQLVTLRTLSVPAGRAMFMFSSRSPLLTEKLPIPSFSLQCVMKPSNVTISADRSSFSEEKVCWAFFHNGAATGLAISKSSKGIDTSWILFNKPQELTNRHAGFLLALGLNGHLKSLAKWVAFKYLTPKHTMTSIGLLLGLSASYLGTMDTLITRLLSVHVTRMLPQGAAELNLSPLTQTAGIMGIGFLYCNSQHRRMSEVMLSEIENIEHEESPISQEDLRDEGYRLAAGFALGFINLGKGKDMKGLRDMHIVERLLGLTIGTKNVDLVHILDRATAGATVALAIIFMKTNDKTLAEKINIPDTTVQFEYVRPDIFLLRTLALHLIMWNGIKPTREWIIQSLPSVYRGRYRLTNMRRLCSDDMPLYNIIAGLCLTLGLRFAGSASPQARDLLLLYLDQFIRICRLPAVNYDGKLTRNSVRHCQDIVGLSVASVMAGTGDLALFRRLRSLHGRIDADTPYGSHMAAHMAIGLLFLGGGSYTLGTSDLAVASLLCAFYPLFPATVLDNKCHLQAFRHLWVLAAEPRCLVPRDADTRRPISVPISLTMKNGVTRETTAPCLLPHLGELAMVKTRGQDHWPLTLDFEGNEKLREKFCRGDQSIFLRRNMIYNPAGSSIFASTLLALSEAQGMLPLPASLVSTTQAAHAPRLSAGTFVPFQRQYANRAHRPTHNIWDWIFGLPSLQELDVAEKSLVLPPDPFHLRPLCPPGRECVGASPPWLRLSPIDAKLALESTVNGAVNAVSGRSIGSFVEVRDHLWQLRLLFDWVDHTENSRDQDKPGNNEDTISAVRNDGLWLRRDFIEGAKWKIWGVQVGDASHQL